MRRFRSFKKHKSKAARKVMSDQIAVRKTRSKTPRPCIECGNSFMATHPKVCLCGPICRITNWRRLNPVPVRHCVTCNVELTGRLRLMCTDCRNKPRARKPRICVICGKLVEQKQGYKYCSVECRKRVGYRKCAYFPFALRAVLVAMVADDEVPSHYRKAIAKGLSKAIKTEDQK